MSFQSFIKCPTQQTNSALFTAASAHCAIRSAIVLPWLEIVCGVALVLGVFTRGAGTLIVAVVGVFTPAIFLRALAVMGDESISFFQVEFDCGCGTGSDIIWLKLCTNTGLLLLAILAILSRSRRFSLTVLLDRSRTRPAHCGTDFPVGRGR